MLGTLLRRLFGHKRALLSVGSPVPAFEALDQDGGRVTGAQLAGRRYVLWFYPKADTPG